MDSEVFERLVVMTRAVAVNRPENLVKFTKELTENFTSAATDGPLSFPLQLISTFWRFYRTQPSNSSLVTVVHSGMHYAEMIIFALVEILHAFIVTDTSYVPLIELYVQLLLCQVSVPIISQLSSFVHCLNYVALEIPSYRMTNYDSFSGYKSQLRM